MCPNECQASYRRLYAARMPDDAAADDPNGSCARLDVPAERARRLADLDDAPGAGRRSLPGPLRPRPHARPSSAPSSATSTGRHRDRRAVRVAGPHPAASAARASSRSPPCATSPAACSCSCPSDVLGRGARTTQFDRARPRRLGRRRRHGDDHPQGRAVGEGRRASSCSPRRCARCPTSGTASPTSTPASASATST